VDSLRRIGLTASATDWIENLSLGWLVLVVTAGSALVAAAVYCVVMWLAVGKRREAFKAVSPGMLPPMGLLFGLIVGFLAAQVWSDAGNAQQAVNREASALRAAVILARTFPGAPENRTNADIRAYIRNAVDEEWPAMAHGRESLTVIPAPLADALRVAIRLTPRGDGEKAAQQQMITSLQSALDARRQRIILSESSLNWVKWVGVILVAVLTLIAIAFVHCENRLAAGLALGLFTAAAAGSLILLAVQQRPFSGEFAVRPDPLVQVAPHG
jgi:uncharacterized membrane protein YagU involved in acid resistance